MARWQPFDVVGGAYSDDTRPWTVQDTVNYLVVNAERPGGRSNKMLRGVPGLVTFSASLPESSVRGLYVAEGRLFAVVGTTLYRIATDGSATSLGTIPGVGRCVFTHNQVSGGNQVVIGNGQSGYVFNTTDDTLAQITDDGFPGFRSVDFADQYIIGVEPFGRYWFHSDLADATSYSTLDRAEAEKAPDRIQQAIATGSDILVLGERTGQFFYNTGEATGTFQNRSGAEMDVGAGSPHTACRLDNTVYWLGNDGSVYRLNGYVPQRISTHALEQAISRCTLSDAYAFTFEDRGHKCYLLTFPDGKTWCFDAATQEWTRRESYGFDRWRVSALVKWGRNWIGGDFINGKLYQLDWAVQQEAGEVLEPRRVCGVLHDDQNRMIVNALELVFDTGMDEAAPEMPTPAPSPVLQGHFIYQVGETGPSSTRRARIGYGQYNETSGAFTYIAHRDFQYGYGSWGHAGFSMGGALIGRVYYDNDGDVGAQVSGIYALTYNGTSTLQIDATWRISTAKFQTYYDHDKLDASTVVVIAQTEFPYDVKLWALNYAPGSFSVVGSPLLVSPDNTGDYALCVHNGYVMVLRQATDGSGFLRAYSYSAGAFTLIDTYTPIPAPMGAVHDEVVSDGNFVYLGGGQIFTFDGASISLVTQADTPANLVGCPAVYANRLAYLDNQGDLRSYSFNGTTATLTATLAEGLDWFGNALGLASGRYLRPTLDLYPTMGGVFEWSGSAYSRIGDFTIPNDERSNGYYTIANWVDELT